ncbi:MAG: hypothetical protein ACP5US_12595, partial [Candidatus Kryptoniota bacterium]
VATMFQFHHGTIKTPQHNRFLHRGRKFQFHHGTIKTRQKPMKIYDLNILYASRYRQPGITQITSFIDDFHRFWGNSTSKER